MPVARCLTLDLALARAPESRPPRRSGLPDRRPCERALPQPWCSPVSLTRRNAARCRPGADHRFGTRDARRARGLAPAGDAQHRAGGVGGRIRQQEQHRLGDSLPACRRARSASSARAAPASAPARMDAGLDQARATRVDADASAASSCASPTVIDSTAPLEAAYQTYSPAPPSRRHRRDQHDRAARARPSSSTCAGSRLHAHQRAEHVELEHRAHHRGVGALQPREPPVMPAL